MASVVNINDVLQDHVALAVDCVDRPLLNAYVPNLQVIGQVVTFLTKHLGFPIPSPALLEKIGNRFRREAKSFADEYRIPILTLKKPDRTHWDDCKLDHVRPYLKAAEAEGRTGVVAIVQPRSCSGCSARKPLEHSGRGQLRLLEGGPGMYYFYVLDREFGLGFIKLCTYFPYPGKVWCLWRMSHNSHYAAVRIL